MGKRQIAASAYLSPSITANSYLQTVESPVLFVEAQVGASIKASTNLVDIVHAALLDESGLLQTKYEYPVMQDILAILFSKVLESNASISEDLVREVNKNLGNQSVYTGEIIEFVLTFAREYAEVVSAADTVAKAMSLVQSDQMTVFDAYGHIVNKILSDSVITADDRWLAFSKVNSDASIVSELYASAFGTSKSDAAAVSDLYERVVQFYRDFLSDSILLVDTADFNNGDGLEYAIGKQLSELLSVPDSYDRVVAFLRSVTDTPSVDDTSLYSLSKPITDASVSSDAYDRLCDFQRAFAEALAASESVAKGFGTWFDDSVSQTDSEIVSLNYVRSFADLVDTFISGDPLNNSLVNTFVTNASIGGELLVFAVTKVLADSQATADQFDRVVAFVREYTDLAFASEAINSFAVGKSLSDDQSQADALSWASNKPLSDAQSLEDSYSDVIGFVRAYLDVVTLVDTADFNNGDGLEYSIVKLALDVIGSSDALSYIASFSRAFTDEQAQTDAINSFAVSKTLSDAQALTDSYSNVLAYARIYADTIAIVDSADDGGGLEYAIAKLVADAQAVNDGASLVTGYNRLLTDSQSQSDSAVVSSIVSRAFQDSVQTFVDGYALNESLLGDVAVNASIGGEFIYLLAGKALADGQLTADQYYRICAFVRSVQDSVGTADSSYLAAGKVIADNQPLLDSVGSFETGKPLFDSQYIADSYDDVIGYARAYADSIVTVDAADFNSGDGLEYAFIKQLAHAASTADSASRIVGYDRQPSDSVSELDGLYASVSKQLSDVNQSINDSMSQAVAYARAYTDSTAESDSLFSVFAKPVTDTQPTADAISKAAVFNRAISDSAAMSDVVFAGLVTVRNVFDTVYVNPAPAGLNVWALNNLMVGGTIGGDTFSYVLIKPIPSAQLNGPVVNKNLLNGNVIPGGG